ncbi:uncharacterized protein E0L32_008444 [Thyridium curvatum]|uniref:Uncharacterized protein n=1 Tax=Thyridium curvatum TaxID=1093900 RepID=A0A507B0Q5_9PEZI|nr:uncharacterized protein E0L32_008444 [Thyridium curvatum]TPX10558.1 hypothetical protein E0L32_008444 [Thyridium curvatum]
MPSRKKTKKLLSQLLEAQDFDLVVTRFVWMEAKYLLRIGRRCAMVKIQTDPYFICSRTVDREIIPNFIISQLEAQKLANPDARQIPFTPILNFIAVRSPDDGPAFPTSFQWQSRETHKTHFIFAYIDCRMPSRSYSVQELLSLRGRDVASDLRALADQDEELAKITAPANSRALRNPSEASAPKAPELLPTMEDQKETSASDSEELLYKGYASKLAASKPASRIASKFLAKTGTQPHVATPDDLLPQAEWMYRGRSGSEIAATEPLSAPTGLNAQQSEGFQRFYKAVSSPTHVRVTAGGRIVPNHRGPGSPTSKRAKDKEPEDEASANDAPQEHPGISAEQGRSVSMVAIPSHLYPPYHHPHFGPLNPPMPMMPMPMGVSMPPGFPFAAHAPAENTGAASSASMSKEPQNKENDPGQAPALSDADQGDSKIKISPPEQFDHSKPFLYNGQLMYPMPPSFAPPMGMPPMIPQPYIGSPRVPVFPGPVLGPVPPAASAVAPPPGFGRPHGMLPQFPGMSPGFPGPVHQMQPPHAPPISSIRPSDITSKQIESLRQALKYHEDQLQYNKHQIDEKEMDKTIQMLKSQIEHFQTLHRNQLVYEDKYYPKREKTREEMSKSATPTAPAFISSQPGSTEPKLGKKGSRESLRPAEGINSSRSNEAALHFSDRGTSSQSGGSQGSKAISYDAALAAPFRPRHTIIENHGAGKKDEAMEKRPIASGEQGYKSSSTASTDGCPQISSSDMALRNLKVDGDTIAGIPYLIGVLPSGEDLSTTHGQDYIYKRELTQDEERSRFLYWANAPASIRLGLPKFDGKDFYPLSPNPTSSGRSSSQSMHGRGSHCNNTRVNDPFRPLTPTPTSHATGSTAALSKENTPPHPDDHRVDRRTNPMNVNPRKLGENTGARILHNVLKRGAAGSNDALPSTLSSATAKGFLPQYAGAGSLLSPAYATSRPQQHVENRDALSDEDVVLNFIEARAKKDRRQVNDIGPGSLEQQFRNLAIGDAKDRSGRPAQWEGA